MSYRQLLFFVLVGSAILIHQAHADELTPKEKRILLFGHDDRHQVAAQDAPWNAIARIETSNDEVCSGVLIAPQWVLSAGHCFLSSHGHLQAATSLTLAGQPHRLWHPDRVLIPHELAAGLTPDGDSFIIQPEASPHDIALLHIPEAVTVIQPVPLWEGDANSLRDGLKKQDNRASQAGYPEDRLDTLLAHEHCQIRRLASEGMLEHRCDTLPGDSGSPLLLNTTSGWFIIGIQSSAPDASERNRADNLALAIPTVRAQLARWMKAG